MDRRLWTLTLAASLACSAFAQTAEPEESEPIAPAVQDPLARSVLDLSRIPAQTEVIHPTEADTLEPVAPGLTGGEDWLEGLTVTVAGVPVPSQLPEGMILRDRAGTIWPGPSGLWIFLPSPENRLPGEGAMLIAPNRARDRMTALLEGREPGQPMIVSGQILSYHDHNSLLLTTHRTPTAEESATASTEPDAPTPDAPPIPDTGEPANPAGPLEVDDLIRDLEGSTRAGDRRDDALRERLLAAQRNTAPAPTTGNAPPLLADGTYLAQRRARLTRAQDGSWTLRFDADAQGLGDGALTVLPCRTLMLMENRVGMNPETPLTVSGRVYTSEGRGYFLPAVFRVEIPGDVNPIQ